jgi:pantothenate kinase
MTGITPVAGSLVDPARQDSFADLVSRARALAGAEGPALLGITGAPGAGKTTLALALVAALAADPPPGEPADWVVHVPMDGFHLADVELARLGRADRKGAPDTFDAAGYAALLRRLRTPVTDETVYAPAFDRDIEQPVAGSIPVGPQCRLVVTEGNYLLVDDEPWRRVRRELDAVWYCTEDDELRRDRLVQRHIKFGKEPQAAVAWVTGTDERNAELVAATATRADLIVTSRDVPTI